MASSLRRVFVALTVLTFAGLAFVPRVNADLGDCGQPVTAGVNPAASDCLFILRAAVGSAVCSPDCICDTNGAGGTTASDALVCLAKAVGQSVTLSCPCASTTTSTTTTTSSTATTTTTKSTTTTETTTTSGTTTTTLFFACDLLVNGGFDDAVLMSPENGWTFENNEPGAGWMADGGSPGPYFILNASGQLETDPILSQTVSGLTIGATYRVSGSYRSFAPGFGDPEKQDAFAVMVEPKPRDHDSVVVLGIPRPSPDPLEWTRFRVDFVASDTTATVSFVVERDGDDSSFDVDSLCVTER